MISTSQTICRAREHLRTIKRQYPKAWSQFEMLRGNRGHDLSDWPEWCYCPLAGAYAIVSGGGDNQLGPDRLGDVGILGALAAWRMTQGIYRFDPALYNALIETRLNDNLPTELLFRLPEWCVYLETPGLFCLGVFAHLESDAATGRVELRMVFDCGEEGLIVFPLPLGDWSLSEAVARVADEGRRHAIVFDASISDSILLGDREKAEGKMAVLIEPILSLLLYLCSDQPDIDGRPANPRPTKTKRGLRIFPADNPRLWPVGERIGAALRRACIEREKREPSEQQTESGRARPRPHVRIAHWHTFRTGPGRASRALKWIPPIAVNVAAVAALPATIKKVKR